MEQYSYEEFLEDLSIGREIHFIYKDEEYYIGRGTGKFMFWKFNDSSSEIIGKNAEDLISKVNFDEKSISEIWGLVEFEDHYVYNESTNGLIFSEISELLMYFEDYFNLINYS